MVDFEAEEFLKREEMDAAKIEIRIGRREAVERGAADGGEEEWVGLRGDDAMEAGVESSNNSFGKTGSLCDCVVTVHGPFLF